MILGQGLGSVLRGLGGELSVKVRVEAKVTVKVRVRIRARLTEQCFTSPPTQYRLYGRRFLQVKRPNQQYRSTEGESCKTAKENNTKKHKENRKYTHTHTQKYTNNRYTN